MFLVDTFIGAVQGLLCRISRKIFAGGLRDRTTHPADYREFIASLCETGASPPECISLDQ